MFSYVEQAQAFLAAVYAGLMAGVAYDLLRLFRLLARAGKALTALADIVFWLVSAAMLAVAAALSGVHGLRFYLILGLCSGLVLWSAGLSRVARGASRTIFHFLIPKQEGNANQHGESSQQERGSSDATATK